MVFNGGEGAALVAVGQKDSEVIYFGEKRKKKIQACSNSKAHICLNNPQRHSALNIVGSLSDSQRFLNVVDTRGGVCLKKKFKKTQLELRAR